MSRNALGGVAAGAQSWASLYVSGWVCRRSFPMRSLGPDHKQALEHLFCLGATARAPAAATLSIGFIRAQLMATWWCQQMAGVVDDLRRS